MSWLYSSGNLEKSKQKREELKLKTCLNASPKIWDQNEIPSRQGYLTIDIFVLDQVARVKAAVTNSQSFMNNVEFLKYLH